MFRFILSVIVMVSVGFVVTGCDSDSDSQTNLQPQRSNITGSWSGEYLIPGASKAGFSMELVQKGEDISGTFVEGDSMTAIYGTLQGNDIDLTTSTGGNVVSELSGRVNVQRTAMSGTMISYAIGMSGVTGNWSAVRN